MNSYRVSITLFFSVLSLQSLGAKRTPLHLFQNGETREIIYIDALSNKGDDLRVFIGPQGSLEQRAVLKVTDFMGRNIVLNSEDRIGIPETRNQKIRPKYVSEDFKSFELIENDPSSENLRVFGINPENPTAKILKKPIKQVFDESLIKDEEGVKFSIQPDNVLVEAAFVDSDGNSIVLVKDESNKFFPVEVLWWPKGEEKLVQVVSSGMRSSEVRSQFTFQAPTDKNPSRTAVLKIEQDGSMTVTCDGVSSCFRRESHQKEKQFEAMVRGNFLGIASLPQVREIHSILRMDGTNQYFVIDYLKFGGKYRYNVLAGELGSLSQIEVSQVTRDRNGTLEIHLADGRLIYLPSSLYVYESPAILASPAATEGILLVRQIHSTSMVEELGLPSKRYQAILRTPAPNAVRCDAIFL